MHPAATSALIHNFVWGWAIEWAFFILEVATALACYATWDKVRPRTHLLLIILYAFAAYMSLVIIQGITRFMLTPGRWLATRSFWDGFLNPTYLPGLLLRTGICLFLAGAYMTFAALREKDRAARARLVRPRRPPGRRPAPGGGGTSLVGGCVAGLSPGPVPRREAPPSGPGVDPRRLVVALFVTAVLALLALGLPRFVMWPQAAVALLAACAVLGTYERLREGARKPFVIRDFMFSNGLLVSEIDAMNRDGILSKAGGRLTTRGRHP